MSSQLLEALRARIRRAEAVLLQSASAGFEQRYTLADGATYDFTVSGIKSSEQLEDELLTVFIWVWSLKDHLKEAYRAKNLDPRYVENIVNQSAALQYVADIANRAKHAVLRESRSGQFAELINVGIVVPQSAFSKISWSAFSVGVDVTKTNEVELQASVKLKDGSVKDAFTVLSEAINEWERSAIPLLSA